MSADQYDRSKPVMDPWCPNCRQPWPTPEQEALQKSAIEYFSSYFENNYHGTVVFSDPRWHAPRVFRAALWALQQAKKDAESAAPETRAVPEGHFWRGDAWPSQCKNCDRPYSEHLHTDEASLCPVADGKETPAAKALAEKFTAELDAKLAAKNRGESHDEG